MPLSSSVHSSVLILTVSSAGSTGCKMIPVHGGCTHFKIQNDEPYRPGTEQPLIVSDCCSDVSGNKNATGIECLDDLHCTDSSPCKRQNLQDFRTLINTACLVKTCGQTSMRREMIPYLLQCHDVHSCCCCCEHGINPPDSGSHRFCRKCRLMHVPQEDRILAAWRS